MNVMIIYNRPQRPLYDPITMVHRVLLYYNILLWYNFVRYDAFGVLIVFFYFFTVRNREGFFFTLARLYIHPLYGWGPSTPPSPRSRHRKLIRPRRRFGKRNLARIMIIILYCVLFNEQIKNQDLEIFNSNGYCCKRTPLSVYRGDDWWDDSYSIAFVST